MISIFGRTRDIGPLGSAFFLQIPDQIRVSGGDTLYPKLHLADERIDLSKGVALPLVRGPVAQYP